MTLASVTAVHVTRQVADDTDEQLRTAGRQGYELFVLWSGVVVTHDFVVRTVHVPQQTAYRGGAGVCVRVDGPALHRLNRWLYEHEEQLGVQVHSHPTDAYHSETDDGYAIVTQRGGVSIVVPHFGAAGVRGEGIALYRLGPSSWVELGDAERRALLRVEA